ncbi:MAG: ABC transporter substrate-binding protein [Dehalococcoidia bacterium]|nr:ABC transporter substrate-binding protein [Dehalococcoidia bacterium]
MTQRRVFPLRGGEFAGSKASLRKGLVARRFFGLVLVIMMIGVPLLSACSNDSTTPTTPTAPSGPSGSLTIAVNFRNGGLDPMVNTPNTLQTMAMEIYDALVELTPDAVARPGIAERWEIATDGLSHTFFIRKGVKFQDGTDLTGADVKFSLERIMDPKANHQDAATWRAAIAGVDLKDDYTVVIRLKQPLFELLNGFADYSGATAVLPKKYIEANGNDYFAAHPMGSGPFKVVKWEVGNRLELEAMDTHWRAVPKFKNITLVNVLEEGTKVAMLKTGELDIAEISPDSAATLKAAGLRMQPFAGGAQYYGGSYFDMAAPEKYALGNIKNRKALSLAVDRKELGDKLYGGFAVPSTMFYALPTAYFWDATQLSPDPFDPEGAKKLMTEAGYPSGFPLKVWDIGAGSILTTLNQALVGYYGKVGIKATSEAIEQAALNNYVRPKPTAQMYDTVRTAITGGGVFNFEKMTIGYHSTKGGLMNTNDKTLDALIDKVPLTLDLAEKKKTALQAAVLAKNSYWDFGYLDMQTLLAVGPKVGELKPIKGMTGFAAAFETITHGK